MRIIYNNIIPFKGYATINIFGVIFARNSVRGRLSRRALRHERIHTLQMKEMLFIFFYLWYMAEFVFRRCQTNSWKQAYYAVSFEQEAYYNQDFEEYESQRKKFAWIYFI